MRPMPSPAAVVEEPRCRVARNSIKLFFVDAARQGQCFVPIDKLRSYLTRSHVLHLLECRCPTCRRDHGVFRPRVRPPAEYISRIVGPDNGPNAPACVDPAKTALTLFALLLYIEHPLLIIGFVMRGCSDHILEKRTPNLFSVNNLREPESYCSEFADRVAPDVFRAFVSEFSQHLPQFSIPSMDSGEYSVYGLDTILPFVKERKVGVRNEDGTIRQEGANGKVYAFEIWEAYRKFPHAQHCKRFARKEIERNSELAFHLENNNLEHALQLEDPHIVKMIKAYRHGDTFNLIFPYAETNLDHLLRDPNLDVSNSIQGAVSVESHPAWQQVLGIATALHKIGGPTGKNSIFGSSNKIQYQGVHFDLKPANILVDDKGTWIISDFGQSTFQETNRSSSRIMNGGGTEAYAPPEIDNIDSRFSRRYDIWSLACIMLEVLAFVVLGYDGLRGCKQWKGLDEVRRTRSPWSSRVDHAFFCRESPQGSYIVKREIMNFMKFLAKSEGLNGQEKSRVFVERLLELIVKMLEPDAEHRIEIGEVVRRLEAIIAKARPEVQALEQTVAVDGEKALGEPGLSNICLWHLRQRNWREATLQVFEDRSSNLRTCTVLTNNSWLSEVHLSRADVMLIPRYFFRDHPEPYMSEAAIYFSNINTSQQHPGLVFSFSDQQATVFVQSIFTNHKIEASFPIQSFRYEKYKSLSGRISHLLNRNEKIEADNTDLGTGVVQLWSEIIKVDEPANEEEEKSGQNSFVSAHAVSSSPRPVRMQPHQQAGYREVPLRRMVIFVHKSRKIILVPMGRNWLKEKQGADQPKDVRFSPTKPTRDPSFEAAALVPFNANDENSFPGIPLSLKVLRSIEYQNKFECKAIGLTFRYPEHREKFAKTYEEMKDEWRTETKAAERKPYYTPVPPPVSRDFVQPQMGPESRTPSWRLGRLQSNGVKKSEEPKPKDRKTRPPHTGGSRT